MLNFLANQETKRPQWDAVALGNYLNQPIKSSTLQTTTQGRPHRAQVGADAGSNVLVAVHGIHGRIIWLVVRRCQIHQDSIHPNNRS